MLTDNFVRKTIEPTGRVLIPLQMRNEFGINGGDTVRIYTTAEGIVIVKDADQPDRERLSIRYAELHSIKASMKCELDRVEKELLQIKEILF